MNPGLQRQIEQQLAQLVRSIASGKPDPDRLLTERPKDGLLVNPVMLVVKYVDTTTPDTGEVEDQLRHEWEVMGLRGATGPLGNTYLFGLVPTSMLFQQLEQRLGRIMKLAHVELVTAVFICEDGSSNFVSAGAGIPWRYEKMSQAPDR